jgi:hypothetical protein
MGIGIENNFFSPTKNFTFIVFIPFFPDTRLAQPVSTQLSLYTVKMAVFWVVASCILVEVYQRFRGTCCLHLMMEAERTSETLVNFYQTIRRYNPEDSHIHTHRLRTSNPTCTLCFTSKSPSEKETFKPCIWKIP